MRIRNAWTLSFVVAMAVGCGSEADSGGSKPAASIPPAVVITGLSIAPGGGTLDLDQVAALSAVAQMSNGTQQAVSAAWTSSDPAVAALSSPGGSVVTVMALKEGTTDIQATASGWSATVTFTVTWSTPPDPGPVFAADSGRGVIRYSSAGSGPVTVYPAVPWSLGMALGFTMNASRTTAYALVDAGGSAGTNVHSVDVSAGTGGIVGTFPADPNGNIGMDIDSQGRLYTAGFNGGLLHRLDPSTGQVMQVGSGVGDMFALAVGPDDRTYHGNSWAVGPTYSWVLRHDPSTDTLTTWATAPAALVAETGYGALMGGLAINRMGETFVIDAYHPDVYRFTDLNGDGDASDAGEAVKFGTAPAAVVDPFSRYTMGLGATRGGGVLVNIMTEDPSEVSGLFWVKDSTTTTLFDADFAWGGWPALLSAAR